MGRRRCDHLFQKRLQPDTEKVDGGLTGMENMPL